MSKAKLYARSCCLSLKANCWIWCSIDRRELLIRFLFNLRLPLYPKLTPFPISFELLVACIMSSWYTVGVFPGVMCANKIERGWVAELHVNLWYSMYSFVEIYWPSSFSHLGNIKRKFVVGLLKGGSLEKILTGSLWQKNKQTPCYNLLPCLLMC